MNDFILPSNPILDGKTFVDCEIVGPCNIYLMFDNNISEVKGGRCDGVILTAESQFLNGYIAKGCTFRGCLFHRVTFFVTPDMYKNSLHVDWLNWISHPPAQEQLPLDGLAKGNRRISTPITPKH